MHRRHGSIKRKQSGIIRLQRQRWINDDERLQSDKNNSRYITFTADTFGWVKYLKVKNYQDSEKQVANWGTLENTSDVLKN